MSVTSVTATATTTKPLTIKMPAAIPFARIMSTVEHHNLRFVILDCPTANTLPLYLQELQQRGVTDVVRLCEPTYDKTVLEANGIQVHDWPFKDGGIPPQNILHSFLSLCDERFGGLVTPPKDYVEGTGPVIAVHCVAGLGRAPVLVTAALVEAGMVPLDAVEFVRRRRRGALNSVQLSWMVDSYKRQWKRSATKTGITGIGMGSFLTKKAANNHTDDIPLGSTTKADKGSAPSTNVSLMGNLGRRMFKIGRSRAATDQVAV
ncbi:protein-tyrosine phosphatase-like protein [Fimicolochytrium jonesii]|uniref:protein-tyrosine phosphatase-like protein n=1 Tax=Fimicolochytrium jonesii TaxID=1396493 RepID=UPI0022FEAE64|nr:protein-tyrosine phosphatase-like protein [Fimicolochytrium jonesii]KAI8825012.1 protein-tyrosine phosphatase-like protein [Fimicolochytrium jonesii]